MEQTFFKTIEGHKLEFNRLLYPISYQISTKDIEITGAIFSVVKDENGAWNLLQEENAPHWLSDIRTDLFEAILANEALAA